MGLGFKTLQFENIKKKKSTMVSLTLSFPNLFTGPVFSLEKYTSKLSFVVFNPMRGSTRKVSFCPEDLQNLRKVAYFLDYFCNMIFPMRLSDVKFLQENH